MNEKDYLVGYKEALEEISTFITQTTKRYPNNPLAVLNDIIVKVHQELADKRIALRDMDEFDVNIEELEKEDILQLEEVMKAFEDFFNQIVELPFNVKVVKVEKGGKML